MGGTNYSQFQSGTTGSILQYPALCSVIPSVNWVSMTLPCLYGQFPWHMRQNAQIILEYRYCYLLWPFRPKSRLLTQNLKSQNPEETSSAMSFILSPQNNRKPGAL